MDLSEVEYRSEWESQLLKCPYGYCKCWKWPPQTRDRGHRTVPPVLHRDSLCTFLYIIFTRLVKHDANSRTDILSFFTSNQMAAKCVWIITTFNLILSSVINIQSLIRGKVTLAMTKKCKKKTITDRGQLLVQLNIQILRSYRSVCLLRQFP